MNGVNSIIEAFSGSINKIIKAIGNWGFSAPADDSKSGIKIGDKTYSVVVSLNGCYWYIDDEGKKQSIAKLPKTEEWSWINIAEKVIKDFKTCYRTPGGKVEVWSWFLLNDQMDVLREQHRITDSTDVDNQVGTLLDSIPDTWVMTDCDLPDMTDRNLSYVQRCYNTPNGKVQIEGLESLDGKIEVRESTYKVIQSTDPNYAPEYELKIIPSDWVRTVCDFPDMSDRHVMKINECYATAGGKIHVGGYRALDSIIGVRAEYIIVMETTDTNIEIRKTYNKVQDGWNRIVCDFPDATTADTEIVENCYQTEGGKVQIRTYLVMDGYGDVRESKNMVLKTSDPKYNIGAEIDEIPSSWLSIECDFASATQRHMKEVRECYKSTAGEIYVEGQVVMDNKLNSEKMSLMVMESTDPAITVGQVLTQVPAGYTKTVCRCNCCCSH